MSVKRMKFDVLLEQDGQDVELRVEVRYADVMRGELEAGKQGIAKADAAPLANTAVWVWAALTRQKLIETDFQTFKRQQLVNLAQVKDGSVDVDPTPAGPGSPSSSPTTSEADLPTGSTLTSTND